MKNWTKKFLNKKADMNSNHSGLLENADKAEKNIGLPRKLWMELSPSKKKTPLLASIGKDIPSAFMAGVVIGWVEKDGKIK